MQPKFYVMVGLPGSGKSTYARRTLRGALRISLDDLRLMFSGRTFDARIEPAVAVAGEALMEAMARHAAATGTDILLDATNVSRARRARPIELARKHGLSPVAVYVECPLPIAQARNQRRAVPVPPEVVANFNRRLEPPTMEEGFDQVIRAAPAMDSGEGPIPPPGTSQRRARRPRPGV